MKRGDRRSVGKPMPFFQASGWMDAYLPRFAEVKALMKEEKEEHFTGTRRIVPRSGLERGKRCAGC